MVYEKKLNLSAHQLDEIENFLNGTQDEDRTIVYTVHFPDCIEVDIKCCGVQDGTPYTEAVLFSHGSQVCCTEPGEDFIGEWWLETKENKYIIMVGLEINELLVREYEKKMSRVNRAIKDISKIIAQKNGVPDKWSEILNEIHVFID